MFSPTKKVSRLYLVLLGLSHGYSLQAVLMLWFQFVKNRINISPSSTSHICLQCFLFEFIDTLHHTLINCYSGFHSLSACSDDCTQLFYKYRRETRLGYISTQYALKILIYIAWCFAEGGFVYIPKNINKPNSIERNQNPKPQNTNTLGLVEQSWTGNIKFSRLGIGWNSKVPR